LLVAVVVVAVVSPPDAVVDLALSLLFLLERSLEALVAPVAVAPHYYHSSGNVLHKIHVIPHENTHQSLTSPDAQYFVVDPTRSPFPTMATTCVSRLAINVSTHPCSTSNPARAPKAKIPTWLSSAAGEAVRMTCFNMLIRMKATSCHWRYALNWCEDHVGWGKGHPWHGVTTGGPGMT